MEIKLKLYNSEDLEQIARLFYDTVHAVNIRDYTEPQVNAWATGNINLKEWDKSLSEHLTYVALADKLIIGFGDIDADGYLDRLYVHKDYQRRGIATALCNRLESEIEADHIKVHASITARPFFEKRCYQVIAAQEIERCGVRLKNYIMVKKMWQRSEPSISRRI